MVDWQKAGVSVCPPSRGQWRGMLSVRCLGALAIARRAQSETVEPAGEGMDKRLHANRAGPVSFVGALDFCNTIHLLDRGTVRRRLIPESLCVWRPIWIQAALVGLLPASPKYAGRGQNAASSSPDSDRGRLSVTGARSASGVCTSAQGLCRTGLCPQPRTGCPGPALSPTPNPRTGTISSELSDPYCQQYDRADIFNI